MSLREALYIFQNIQNFTALIVNPNAHELEKSLGSQGTPEWKEDWGSESNCITKCEPISLQGVEEKGNELSNSVNE